MPSLTHVCGMTPWWNHFDTHCPVCSPDAFLNGGFGGKISLALLENMISKLSSCDSIDL